MFDFFKFYFLDPDGRSYYVTNSGNVDKSATPKPLELSPEGKKSISIGYERSIADKELRVDRTFTLPTDFVRKSGKILKSIVYSKNVGEKIYLLIQKLKVTVDLAGILFRMQYQFLYKGQVDLTSFIDKDVRTTITVSEGGIAKQIKANEGTTYEMDLDSDSEAVLLKHDGITLYDTANFTVTAIDQKTVFGPGTGRYLPASMVSRDGNAAGFAGFSNDGNTTYNGATVLELAHFATTQAIPGMRLSGSIKVQIDFPYTPSLPLTPSERYSLGLSSNLRPGGLPTPPGIAYLANHINLPNKKNTVQFDFDITFDSLENEYFSLYAFGPGFVPIAIEKFEYLETNFKIEFHSKYRTTYVKCLPLSVLGKRLTGKNTGSESNIDTSFLSQHDNLVFSSGDGIRGLTGAKIKTTLKDYKDFVWVVLAASRGIESGKLIFQEFPHFLDASNPIPLGEVAKFNTYVAKDLLCNKINVGYPVQLIDDINGKLSFHNTFYFSSPLDLEEPKALDLITQYIACCYYQEIIRINFDGKITTDDNSDNEVMVFNTEKKTEAFTGTDLTIGTDLTGNFFTITGVNDKVDLFKIRFAISGTASNDGTFSVKSIVNTATTITVYVNENIAPEIITSAQFSIEYVQLYRPTYTSFAGVPEIESLYNIEELSPKRIFLKHAKWINSIFYGFQGQKITFNSTEKNSALETTLNGVTIKEKASYEIKTDILFKPFYFEFDTIVPVDTVENLDANANRCFLPQWYNKNYKGFSRKIIASTNDNKSQQFKLLAAPDTDLTTLIF